MSVPDMKYFNIPKAAAIVTSFAIMAAGCKDSGNRAALTPEQIPTTVQNAFKDAAPDVKSLADDVAASLQNKEDPKAFGELQVLSARPDLTPEQREAAVRAIHTLTLQLAAAAAKGDQNAEEMLQQYRATK